MNHRVACEEVARHALKHWRWCDLACVELAGSNQRFPEPQPPGAPWDDERYAWYERRREWQKTAAAGGGVLDVVAMTSDRRTTEARPRVMVVEVKTTGSDLRRDLGAGKMLRYEPQATHCALAAPDNVLDQAEAAGLPATWGMLRLVEHPATDWHPARVEVLGWRRQAKPTGTEYTLERRHRLATRIAISFAHRALRDAENTARLEAELMALHARVAQASADDAQVGVLYCPDLTDPASRHATIGMLEVRYTPHRHAEQPGDRLGVDFLASLPVMAAKAIEEKLGGHGPNGPNTFVLSTGILPVPPMPSVVDRFEDALAAHDEEVDR